MYHTSRSPRYSCRAARRRHSYCSRPHCLCRISAVWLADLLLFYTQEFAFVDLHDAYTTGSSIMPQKRNPDVFELLRGRGASALGCLNEALAVYAKLPSGYQRDLQLLKAPLFRGIDLCRQSLAIVVPALDADTASNLSASRSIRRCTQPAMPTHWWLVRAFRFATPTSVSPRNLASRPAESGTCARRPR